MRRILAPFLVLALAALGLSACTANAAPYAAKVNGETIPSSTLNETMSSIAGDKGLRCMLAAAAQSGNLQIEGAGTGTYSAQFAASQLTQLIEQKALEANLKSLHLTPGPQERALATSRLVSELTPQSGSNCTVSGSTTMAALSPSYRNMLVSLEADEDVVGAHLAGVSFTKAGVLSYAAAHPLIAELACVSAILVVNKADAEAARKAIVQGASFATVARAKSTDAESAQHGGALGCISPTLLAAPLSTDVEHLQTGELSQPISFDNEDVLLEVTKRVAPSSIQAADSLLAAESTAEGEYILKLTSKANVSIDPSYGNWADEQGAWQVVPPSGPANKDLANPTAITPANLPNG